jgi:hypothetical protein
VTLTRTVDLLKSIPVDGLEPYGLQRLALNDEIRVVTDHTDTAFPEKDVIYPVKVRRDTKKL